MSKIIIGLDPGKSGGVAWFDADGRPCAEKMPDTLSDLWDLLDLVVRHIPMIDRQNEVSVYLETVHSSPGMGVVSAFTFGQGYGALEMAVIAANLPLNRVRPQVWQKAMGCMTKGDKNVSKRRAQELFPSIKITHAIADSLLIARYGQQMEKG